MGSQQCLCIKGETEEELISRIIQSMRINEINVYTAYEDFINCIVDHKLDENSYKLFILKMIGNDRYQNAQKDFFNNIYIYYKKDDKNIKVIGSLICFLAKGSITEKVEVLFNHLKLFYNDLVSGVNDLIVEMVQVNTKLFEVTLKTYIGQEGVRNLKELWNDERIENLTNSYYSDLQSYINRKVADNYDELLKKYLEIKFNDLQGETIRNTIYEHYMKERTK